MQESALYFPTIEFRSPLALKANLLVWDRVYRIVPDGYSPNDDDEIRAAIDAGLIRSVKLEDEDLRATADRFSLILDDLPSLPAGFDPGRARLHNIHLDKIDARLYPVLEELAPQVSAEWIALPAEVARGYMLTLAVEIARRRDLSLTTDDQDSWVASAFISEDGAFSDYVFDAEAHEQFCQVGFQDVLPLDAGALPMDKLIKLSRDSRDERAAFRAAMAELSRRLVACESPSHVEDLVQDYRATLSQSVDALRRRVGFIRRSEGSSLLCVGVPIAASIIAALLPAGIHATSIAGAVVVGLVGALGDSRRNAPPVDRVASYLLQATSAAGSPLPDLRIRMEEFIND